MNVFLTATRITFIGLIILICVAFACKYLPKRITELTPLFIDRSIRNIGYALLSGVGIILFSFLALIFQNPRWYLMSAMMYTLHVYWLLCWPRLAITFPVKFKPEAKQPRLVRPFAAFWLGITWLFLIAAFVVPTDVAKAGPLTRLLDFISNHDLFLQGETAPLAIYQIGCMLRVLYELRSAIRTHNALAEQGFRYRCYSIGGAALLELADGLTNLGGFVFFRFSNDAIYPNVCGLIRTPIEFMIILWLGLLIPLDRWLREHYEQRRANQAAKNIHLLYWFYDQSYHSIPADYRFHGYSGMSDASPLERLDIVVRGLNFMRRTLYRAEAWREADRQGISIDKFPPAKNLHFKKEVQLWYKWLTDGESVSLLKEYSKRSRPNQVVPPLPDDVESAAQHYTKIAKIVRRQIEIKARKDDKKMVDYGHVC